MKNVQLLNGSKIFISEQKNNVLAKIKKILLTIRLIK